MVVLVDGWSAARVQQEKIEKDPPEEEICFYFVYNFEVFLVDVFFLLFFR